MISFRLLNTRNRKMIQNTFHYLSLPPLPLQAINIVKIKRPVVGGGGGGGGNQL